MITTELYPIAIIPVLLLALAGWLILRGDTERAGHRFLLFLLGTGALLLLLVFLISPGYDDPYTPMTFELPIIIGPALIGILVLVVLNIHRMKSMNTRGRIAAILLLLGMIVLLGLLWNTRLGVEFMILPGALILTLIWSLGWRYGWIPELLGLISLGTLVIFSQTMGTTLPMWFNIPFAIFFFLSPVLLTVLPVLFIVKGIHQNQPADQPEAKRLSRGRLVFRYVLAAVLLASLLFTTFWGGVWDQTADMGFGFMLAPFGGVAAIVAGLLMTLTLRGKYRLLGLLYIFLVPSLLFLTYDAGMKISHHTLTEKRAGQIAEAIQGYYEREGAYPESLQALTPRDLLYIPGPILLMGEHWCYQSDKGYYRLGAIYREFWSMPLSLRIYAEQGTPPAEVWDCEQRLAELKQRYDPPPFAGIPESVPTSVPLPTSVISMERESIQPILSARTVPAGDWSPDGMYLIFGLPEIAGDQSVISLSFLKADTGEICPIGDTKWVTSMDYNLREHTTWLSDGRLLYVSSEGELTVFRPCEPDPVDLTSAYPTRFTHALANHPATGRVLLKNKESFWILDGNSMDALPIPNVTPNPYELHRDNFDWSPKGTRLAISRLNGQDASAGSTLFIVDAITGVVETELPLEYASDQSAPMIEWMSEDELLLHGSGALFLIDFRLSPPKFTDVLRDIFLLDISYPDDISTFAWEGEHLSVRVNHPRNQGIYIYHPETGQVEIIQPHEASPLFFFPNGEMVEMANYASAPLAEDAYELIWVDKPDIEPRFITVDGHLPRDYPILFPRYLPDSEQLVFSSSQGISLISIADGQTIRFWELAGGGGYSSSVLPPSTYPVLVVVAEGDGMYYLPLR